MRKALHARLGDGKLECKSCVRESMLNSAPLSQSPPSLRGLSLPFGYTFTHAITPLYIICRPARNHYLTYVIYRDVRRGHQCRVD